MDRKTNPAGCLIVFVAIVAALAGIVAVIDYAVTHLRPASDQAEEQTVEEEHTVVLAGAPVASADAVAEPMIRTYTEGESPVPEWWQPGEEMAVEWTDNAQTTHAVDYNAQSIAHPPVGISPGGIDWNIETELVGWDGHRMEVWEMDLYSRIVYLEFWGTSRECCEAGADSILNLWASGYFGSTLGGVLTARAENGALVYTTYGFVWDAEYDPDGLAEIRKLCEERFLYGPEWGAEFFQLYGWPEWAEPMYELDGVYFSTGKGW